MNTEPQRTGQVVSIARAIARVVDVGDLAGGLQQLGHEPWAVQDAEVATWRAAEQASRERERVHRQRKALAEAGFPRRAIEHALEADEDNPVIARLRTWNVESENVLVLSGPKGIGKTVAATWWALRRSLSPTFVRATTFAASSRYDRDGRERWLGASALVLDDLGAEFSDTKGSFLVDLDELVDVFYGDRKPLLVTSNCPHERFVARYGERIVDRLRECGTFFEWSGPSLRGKAAP